MKTRGGSSRRRNTSGNILGEYPELGGLLGSIGAFGLGATLLFDDAKDLGEFSTPEHPSPIHHWIWGLLLMTGGTTGICAFGVKLLERLKKKYNI